MGLLGEGLMVSWYDVDPGRAAAHDDWHSQEHLAERVAVPGFLRGHRFTAIAGAPRYLILYEVERLETLVSAPYLERLDNPTPWTARQIKTVRRMNRSLCRVLASEGRGVGGFMTTIRLAPEEGRAEALRAWLADEILPALARTPGLMAAHLAAADAAASRTGSQEKRLRPDADSVADWVLLVGGYEAEALAAAAGGRLAEAALVARGARPRPVVGRYRLAHVMLPGDLAGAGC